MFFCNICSTDFKFKHGLIRHLSENRCKGDILKLNDLFQQQKDEIIILKNKITQLTVNGNNNQLNTNVQNVNNKNVTMKIEFNINPVTKLDVNYIDHIKMREVIEKYDEDREKSRGKLNLLLSNYIKNIICNKDHPENHSVKYVSKRPPTYNSVTEDSTGNKINVIKDLKDTCELLSDPVLDLLKIQLKECLKKYKKDEDFDYQWYEDAFTILKMELNKDSVKKALKSVLKNDILNNIEMKLSLI